MVIKSLVIILMAFSISVESCEEAIFDEIEAGNIASVSKYLSKGGDPDLSRKTDINNCVYETSICEPDTLISTALFAKQDEIAIELVKSGADFKKESKSLSSPIQIAIELDRIKFIRYLIEVGLISLEDKIGDFSFREYAIQLGEYQTRNYIRELKNNKVIEADQGQSLDEDY